MATFAAAGAFVVPSSLLAQDQASETFSLPTASPTPTPAPQGPVDERVGVPIAPRVIVQEPAPSSSPTSTPPASEPASETASEPAPTPTPSSTVGSSSPATSQRPDNASRVPSTRPTGTRAQPQVRNPDAQGAAIGQDDGAAPGFEALEDASEGTASRSAEGWYNVDEAGGENAQISPSSSTTPVSPVDGSDTSRGSSSMAKLWERVSSQSGLLASLIAAIAALLGIIALVIMRRKKEAEGSPETQATVLTAGVRASMGEEMETQGDEPAPNAAPPAPRPTAPPAAPTKAQPEEQLDAPDPAPIDPPLTLSPAEHASPELAPETLPAAALPSGSVELDLALVITGASRSIMRLSVDFSLEITNRSSQPVRHLNIAGELACAQQGASRAAPIDKTKAIEDVERIAPGQSRRIKGTLQLPLHEITTIDQGGKPVVIPLVHFRLGTPDQTAIKRTFVVGTPSAASPTRVHPLVLEGPPGSLPGMRAQLIKQA